jgi:S-DNA-T family DNA segregation ATPase FtsK/SpoIIIE
MAQTRLYTSHLDEERIDRLYAEGLKLLEPNKPSRNPKWWGLRLALAVSLAQRTPPERVGSPSPYKNQYQLQQLTGWGKTSNADPDITDALRAILSIYHGEDLFAASGAPEQEEHADRRFIELLYDHVHRGLELIDGALLRGQPLERFLAEALFSFVEERVVVNTDELLSRLLERGIRAQIDSVQRGPRVDVLRLRLGQAEALERLRRSLDELAFAMGLPEGQLIASPTNIPMVATLTVPRPPEDWDTHDEKDLQKWLRAGNTTAQLPIWLGATSDGSPFMFDLMDAPHLLVAGATGSGKSMCLHAIILSLTLARPPSDVQLVLIDPKGGMEFSVYSTLPHLRGNGITSDVSSSRVELEGLLEELKARQKSLSELGANNLEEAIKAGVRLPRVVVIVDELADLLFEAPDIEQLLTRLAQIGRAAGYHLVLGTQRPDSQILSGLLRSNVSSRIALKVAKGTDSQIILGEPGAERLLGKGDMLVRISSSPLARVQGLYLPMDAIRNFVTDMGGSP